MTNATTAETPDELIAATGDEVATTAPDQADRALAAIWREPLQGVAITAGVGFLASLILRRW